MTHINEIISNPYYAEALYFFVSQDEEIEEAQKKCIYENLSFAEYVLKYRADAFIEFCKHRGII